MAKAKTENFSEEEINLADLAKALSHPARIRILKILASMNLCMCGEIVDELPLAQATVSQHLKELKRVGLVKGQIEGPKICYCIDGGTIQRSYEEFIKLFNNIGKECKRSCKTTTK